MNNHYPRRHPSTVGTLQGDAFGLLVGAVALGALHGVEPGHGWSVAAPYALDQTNRWAYGFAASLVIGVGHLVSGIAMVGVFFYAKSCFDLARVNEPIRLFEGVFLGGPVSVVAGVLLVVFGIREYRHGHSHGTPGADHGHTHHHDHGRSHGHSYAHDDFDDAADRSLFGIAWFAFPLGFAHEEEFEIIALCAGSEYCLELMSAYAVAVVVGIVGLTLRLVAGSQRYEERVEQYAEYLPAFSAAVLVVMGVGSVVGVF